MEGKRIQMLQTLIVFSKNTTNLNIRSEHEVEKRNNAWWDYITDDAINKAMKIVSALGSFI